MPQPQFSEIKQVTVPAHRTEERDPKEPRNSQSPQESFNKDEEFSDEELWGI